MNQLERIRYMESIMDRAETVLSALDEALEQYRNMETELDELEDYYGSDLWRGDFNADENGKLPQDLKRGVLSEDGLWNLLIDRDRLLAEMRRISEKSECED